jgi:hypothetical protein
VLSVDDAPSTATVTMTTVPPTRATDSPVESRAALDELDSAEDAIHTGHDLLAIAREIRRLAEVDPPGPPRDSAGRRRSLLRRSRKTASATLDAGAG